MTQTVTWTGKHVSKQRYMERTWGWGTTAQRPTKWPVNAFYFDNTIGELLQNTGTFDTPVYTSVLGG